MAPRLPNDVAIQMNSVGWPVWLLCTSITVSVFSVIALFAYTRIHAADEDRRRRQQQQQHQVPHQVEVMWSFPEKEDKAARFKRWAEVLRFKPREARPPISADGARLDVKVALEVFYREAEAAGIASAGPGAAAAAAPPSSNPPSSPKHEVVSIPEDEAAAVLREKVKERILQFLIECGPPKGLIPITEEERSAANTPSVPSTPTARHQHSLDMRKLMDSSASPSPFTAVSSSVGSRPQASPCPPPALSLDGEPVLRTETGETVTRELLWAVLARIHAEAQAQAQADAAGAGQPLHQAPTAGPTSAANTSSAAPISSSPSSSSGPTAQAVCAASANSGAAPDRDSLTQPLLGEWNNPLQC